MRRVTSEPRAFATARSWVPRPSPSRSIGRSAGHRRLARVVALPAGAWVPRSRSPSSLHRAADTRTRSSARDSGWIGGGVVELRSPGGALSHPARAAWRSSPPRNVPSPRSSRPRREAAGGPPRRVPSRWIPWRCRPLLMDGGTSTVMLVGARATRQPPTNGEPWANSPRSSSPPPTRRPEPAGRAGRGDGRAAARRSVIRPADLARSCSAPAASTAPGGGPLRACCSNSRGHRATRVARSGRRRTMPRRSVSIGASSVIEIGHDAGDPGRRPAGDGARSRPGRTGGRARERAGPCRTGRSRRRSRRGMVHRRAPTGIACATGCASCGSHPGPMPPARGFDLRVAAAHAALGRLVDGHGRPRDPIRGPRTWSSACGGVWASMPPSAHRPDPGRYRAAARGQPARASIMPVCWRRSGR